MPSAMLASRAKQPCFILGEWEEKHFPSPHVRLFWFCNRIRILQPRPLVAVHYRTNKGSLRRQNRFKLAYAGLLRL
mgnify:CR=1 FL=1